MRHCGVGWPNGAVDNAAVFALPSPDILMLATEGRWHHDDAIRAGKRILWRAVPRVGKRPAELGWSPARFVAETINLTDAPELPITDFIPWNELDLNGERGDNADDWSDLERRYALIGGWGLSVVQGLRAWAPTVRIHWPAFTPDHAALDHLPHWRAAADLCGAVDFHAYDSLENIERQYAAYRQAFPDKPLALTEWHCRGDLDEERRVLAWLAEAMDRDPLFEAACFFIWRWHGAPDWWDDAWDLEHNPDRLALFCDPPTVSLPEPAPIPEVPAMTRDEIVALIVAKAQEHGLVPYELLGGAIAESGLGPGAWRQGVWPDWSAGLFQQTVRYAEEGDHTASDENVALIKRLYFDPTHACDVAAAKFKHWRYDPEVSALQAWTAYNLPASYRLWPNVPNVEQRENYRRGLEEAQRLLGAAPMPTPRVTYKADEPAIAQNDPWSCSATSLRWALTALGRNPSEQWIEDTMLAEGVVSRDLGLLDATGKGLAEFVVRQWGEFGYLANNEPLVNFDWIAAEGGHAYPVLIGGRAWGHWTAVRGYDPERDVLTLANPAENWGGVGQTMNREQFRALGPFSAVRVYHPDLLEPAPAPVEPPAPPPLPPLPPRPTLDEVLAELRAITSEPDERIVGRYLRERIAALAERIA